MHSMCRLLDICGWFSSVRLPFGPKLEKICSPLATSQLTRASPASASHETFEVQFEADGSSTELNMSSMGTSTPSSEASSVLALVLSSAAAMAEPERQAVGKQREE